MRLVQLIYASRLVEGASGSQITSIIEASQRNNARDGVTGALCFSHSYFLQCLEGERGAVNHTYHRIVPDPRHSDLVLLSCREVEARAFQDWSMGYLPASVLTPERVLRYCSSTTFNPYELGGVAARDMLIELSAAATLLRGKQRPGGGG